MKSCEGCFFWSEMVAHAYGSGPVEALCLCEGKNHGKYTHKGCEDYFVIEDDLGAIDSPARLVFDGGRNE